MAGNAVEDAAGVKETPIEPPDEDFTEEVVRIAEQAVETHHEDGCRWDTYFYKVVLGGNVKVVRLVAQHMEDHDMTDTLDWLWQRAAYEESRYTVKKQSDRLSVIQNTLFIGFMVLNIIFTPVFYILHIFTTSLLNRQEKRLSSRVKLPLAYAAFSQNAEMMQFFLSQGVDIEHIDKQGNTVFHYISDLSSLAADRAIEIFISTVQFIDDTDTVRKLLMYHRNSAGLTAVEYAAKFGSPFLLTQILKQPNLLQHTPFAVSPSKVSFGDPNKPPVIDANTKVEFVDVSMYEAGTLANQSTLLNFLSDRDIAAMSKEDLLVFDNSELIGKWVGMKIKQMFGGVLCFQVIDIVITIILLFILQGTATGENSTTFFFWKMEQDSNVQFNEIKAWARNQSYIFKSEAFHTILDGYREDSQLKWMKTLVDKEPGHAKLLLNTTFDDIDPDLYDAQQNKWTVSRNTLDQQKMDRLFDVAITMEEFANHTSHLYVFRHLSDVLSHFAKELLNNEDDIFDENFYMLSTQHKDFYNKISFPVRNETIVLHTVIPLLDLFGIVCVSADRYSLDALEASDETRLQRKVYELVSGVDSDSCFYKGIMNAAENELCDQTDTLDLANYVLHSDNISNKGTPIANLRKTIVLVCIIVYIIIDCIERCVFIWCSMSQQSTVWDMVASVLGRKVPGSYARKQLNLLSYFFIVYQFIIQDFLDDIVDSSNVEMYKQVEVSGTIIFIIAIVVRFLMHIHAMRLLPGIGHFVITTFMMLTDLLNFSVVFGMVLLIFSLLLHILIHNPACPVEKYEGFIDIIDSIFSTFQLTFGHGEFDMYTISTPVKLTYMLYVIIVGLLLMNLIIAIMSTTATDIMAEPWKGALWQVEWLDEATSFEYTTSVIGLLLRRCPCPAFGYKSHKRAGFIVKKKGEEWRVYVENFQCAPLK